MNTGFNNFGARIGKILGDLTILSTILTIYVVFSLLTYLIIYLQVPTFPENQSAFLISYIVATGGDPAPYLQTLGTHWLSYYWILILHVISWLFIPVIIALAADATYRLFERRKATAKLLLRRKMSEILSAETSLSQDEIVALTEEFSKTFNEKSLL